VNKRARLTMWIVGGASLGMLAMSFAAVPLYSAFCRLTGFGGTTQVAAEPSRRILDRMVRVRFDANVDPAAPLEFRPTQPFVEAKLGETILAFYEVTNTSAEAIKAQATYNVAPDKAGVYFNKLECFCFKEKIFQPGEKMNLPVIFYVSPDMDDDPLAKDVRGITLSYTYYRSGALKASARLEDASAVN
jgi:cytochrome c oxidase assembly protein subunit 11